VLTDRQCRTGFDATSDDLKKDIVDDRCSRVAEFCGERHTLVLAEGIINDLDQTSELSAQG